MTLFEKVTRDRLSEMLTFKQKHAGYERTSGMLQAKEKKRIQKASGRSRLGVLWEEQGQDRLEPRDEREAVDGRCQRVWA